MKGKELYVSKNSEIVEGGKGQLFADTVQKESVNAKKSQMQISEKLKEKPHKRRTRKIVTFFALFIIIVLLIVGALGIHFVILPARRVSESLNVIKENLAALGGDFQGKDISSIDVYFDTIREELTKINDEIDRYDFLATHDFTKGYYNNFQVGRGMLDKTDKLITTTLPELKNILKATGFKVDKDQSVNEAEEEENSSLTLVLKELSSYLALYDTIEPQIIDILDDVKDLDPNYLPEYGDINLRENVVQLSKFVDDFPQISTQTKHFLRYLPNLVGANDPARYLLVLQNETEMRASGGLLTAYGNATIHEGEFGDDIFLSDMWNLEIYVSYTLGIDTGYRNIYGQNYLMNLGCGSTYLRAQDAGIYPDLYWTMATVSTYYNWANKYNEVDFPDYDYILIINNAFAENLLALVQPLEVEGYGEVTAESLYDFIKVETDKATFDPGRKDIIKDIANAARDKFLDLPIDRLPEVINTVITGFQAKDIGIAAPGHDEIQDYLDSYGMSGRVVKDFEGDYFQFNEAQNCSLKLNKFIRDTVDQEVYINENGSINREVQVKWLQTKVFEPGLEKQYSPTLSFSYRAWLRFFAPVGTSEWVSDGYKKSGYVGYFPVDYYDKVMDKAVSDNIVQFDHRRFQESDPIERKDINVSYRLPDNINYAADGKYTLLLQKHPGKSWGEEYTITVHHNGASHDVNFVLDRDKLLTYKDGIITVDNYDKRLDWVMELVNSLPWDRLSSESGQEL